MGEEKTLEIVKDMLKKQLTILWRFDILTNDELPKTAGAEKRKDKTPAEERIVMNLFMYVIRSLQTGFFIS